jgi:mannose-1-phosphate guanylyltransferase
MDFATGKKWLNMNDQHYALILAGGSGSRIWPLQHKPLIALWGEKSLFEQTVNRLPGIVARDNIYVVTDDILYPYLRDLMPDLHYVCEPSPRDTAAAVGLGLLEIIRHNPTATVAILSSDHFIDDDNELRVALRTCYQWAKQGQIALLGVLPTFAATGYGYILHDAAVSEGVYRVERFIEKPSAVAAQELIETTECSWDAGILVVSAQVLLNEYARQQPEMLECLRDTVRWREIAPISLDYAIIEGALNCVVVRLDTKWSDVGSWAAIYDVLPKDMNGNVLLPNVVAVNTQDTLVRSTKPTAVIGLQDVIIVDTPEALLVCHRDQAEAVRQVATLLMKTHPS